MNHMQQIARHFREVHFGGNWTTSNLRDQLRDVTWDQAITKVGTLNTIAALAYHVHYYVHEVLKVLQGGPLEASDRLSYEHPPVQSAADWEQLQAQIWTDAEAFAALLETVPEEQLWNVFSKPDYGNYYRNVHGIIEHTHYHLGQIAVIKKMLGSAPGVQPGIH